jgi:ketosteroid isomerase-like protein
MSQENVEVVRKPLQLRERSSRTLDERLSLRFPRLAKLSAAWLIAGRPPTSRLRQGAVWRAVQLGVEAFNRRDLDAVQIGRPPDWEYHPAREFVEAGFVEPCYRGRAGYRDALSRFFEVWGSDIRVEPIELVDLGDRLVVLANLPTRGQASGVAVTQEVAYVITLQNGQPIRQQDYHDHAEALEAGGLRD